MLSIKKKESLSIQMENNKSKELRVSLTGMNIERDKNKFPSLHVNTSNGNNLNAFSQSKQNINLHNLNLLEYYYKNVQNDLLQEFEFMVTDEMEILNIIRAFISHTYQEIQDVSFKFYKEIKFE